MFDVKTENLKDFETRLVKMPQVTRQAARMALNDVLKWSRGQAATQIGKQVNFPSSYLTRGNRARLQVTQRATNNNLTGIITGRFNPTSLARFTRNASAMVGRRGTAARVSVKPGSVKTIERAFVLRLRRGNIAVADAGANANLGLAIRLKEGETVRNKKNVRKFDRGVYLLYGPSVNQVFRSVATSLAKPAGRKFATEFDRQFRRLSRV